MWNIPAGEHTIQIESWTGNGVAADRQNLNLPAGRTVTLTPQLHPVRLSIISQLYREGKPGQRGPRGRQGSPANAANLDEATQFNLFREAMLTVLEDVAAEVQQRRNDIRPRPHHPWTDSYFYSPEGSYSPFGPEGPPGPMGPQGSNGLSGDVLLLSSPENHALLDMVGQKLGVELIEHSLSEALQLEESTLQARKAAAAAQLPQTITIYTPRWKEYLNTKHALGKRTPAAQWIYACVPAPTGWPGAPGPRGEDGEVPAGTPHILVPETEANALLSQLLTDEKLQAQIKLVRSQTENLRQEIERQQLIGSNQTKVLTGTT
jgi:hypothetical protein